MVNFVARVLEVEEFLTRSLIVQDGMILPGKYKHFHFFRRASWGKDHWDESHIGENDDFFKGWNNVECHSMLKRDRKTFYAPLPSDWSKRCNGARVLFGSVFILNEVFNAEGFGMDSKVYALVVVLEVSL